MSKANYDTPLNFDFDNINLVSLPDEELLNYCDHFKYEYVKITANILDKNIDIDLMYDDLVKMRKKQDQLKVWHEKAYKEYMREDREP